VEQPVSNSGEPGQNTLPGLTSEQLQNLLSLIEPSKSGYERLSGNATWILDTGASCQMTGNLNGLSKLELINPIPVELPDAVFRMASLQGAMSLGSKINLSKVLYIPNFHYNLISVAQLIRELRCIVIFTDELCVIQDRTSRSLIGVGELRGGVYCFNEVATGKVLANAMDAHALWHSRLGHPSNRVLSLLPKDLGISYCLGNNKVEPCDVCFRAKQTRNSFDISESKADDLFEIIHCDIWGSYKVSSFCGAHYFLTIVDDVGRAVWIYLMKEKREVTSILQKFIIMVKNQFGKNVKIIRSDNGLEFKSGPMLQFYSEKGILHLMVGGTQTPAYFECG